MNRVLFCGGSPKAPSWAMRGVQIASAHPLWVAINQPTQNDIAQADLVVVVKRIHPEIAAMLNDSGKPVVWDALDFWPQGCDALLPQTVAAARALAARASRRLKLAGIIAANRQMASDLIGVAPLVECIYHHARLDARPLPLGNVIYYDGCEKHARSWLPLVAAQLDRHGWQLAEGKPLAGAGGLLAARDESAGSWIARRWKSQVKGANALAYGLPLLAQRENGYREFMPEGTAVWFDTDCEFKEAIGRFCAAPPYIRPCKPFTLLDAAKEYAAFFDRLL